MNHTSNDGSRRTSAWRTADSIPAPLADDRFVLQPLSEHHFELDYQALMSCRDRLRRELQWGGWPANDFTLNENRSDLRKHQLEFEKGTAFAYSVLQPDCQRCQGCIYIETSDAVADAQLAFWVTDDALEIESTLVSRTVTWLHREWKLDRIALPLRHENPRGIALAESLGFVCAEVQQDEDPASCFFGYDGLIFLAP